MIMSGFVAIEAAGVVDVDQFSLGWAHTPIYGKNLLTGGWMDDFASWMRRRG